MGQAFQGVPPPSPDQGLGRGERTFLLADLQFPRHLTEGAGEAKGECSPIVPDGALEGGKERNR